MKKIKKPILVGLSLLTAAMAGACRKEPAAEPECIYGPPEAFGMEGEEVIEDIYGPPSAFGLYEDEPEEIEEEQEEAEEEAGDETGSEDEAEEESGDEAEDEAEEEAEDEAEVSGNVGPEFQQLIYGPPEMMER